MTLNHLALAPITWMIGASVASCLAVIAIAGSAVTPEIVAGMLGPLVSAVVTWLVIERTHASAPERLTNALVGSFGIKMIAFAVYIAVAIAALSLRPIPFVVTFTIYYVALHAWEALLLKRLLAPGQSREVRAS